MSAGARLRWIVMGAIVAVISGTSATAKSPPMVPPPPAAESSPESVPAGPSAPAAIAPAASTQPGCSCGDRHGFSRWRWHRAHCKRYMQDHFVGYAEEFNEWPLGYALYAHGKTQVANGQAARMAFYDYDFEDGTSKLNLRGQDKLAKVGTYLPTTFAPVVVERTPKEPGLDESRRLAVVAQFARGPFPIPAERVVIGPPVRNGVTGLEPLSIYGNELQGIASGGALGGGVAGIGSFVGGGSAFTGGGLSGSAVAGGR